MAAAAASASAAGPRGTRRRGASDAESTARQIKRSKGSLLPFFLPYFFFFFFLFVARK